MELMALRVVKVAFYRALAANVALMVACVQEFFAALLAEFVGYFAFIMLGKRQRKYRG